VAKKRPVPPRRSSATREKSPVRAAGGSDTTVAVIKWWENVNFIIGPTYGPHDTVVPCAGQLSVTKGEGPLYHDISTKYSNSPNYAHVDFVCYSGGGFGCYVPVSVQKTASGFTFNGFLPVCTKTSICSNGQPKKWQVYVAGELNTAGATDLLSYQYTVDLFCADKVSCTENGSFKGERKEGPAHTFDGDFYGTHEWNVKCCPSRRR